MEPVTILTGKNAFYLLARVPVDLAISRNSYIHVCTLICNKYPPVVLVDSRYMYMYVYMYLHVGTCVYQFVCKSASCLYFLTTHSTHSF